MSSRGHSESVRADPEVASSGGRSPSISLPWSRYLDEGIRQGSRLIRPLPDKIIRSNGNYILETIKDYPIPDELPTGAMHIDVQPDHVLFSGNRLTGVIDFDNSYIGPLAFDLTHTIMWFSSRNGTFNVPAAKALYSAYRRERRLKKNEWAAFYQLVHYAHLSHVLVDIEYLQHEVPKKKIYKAIKDFIETQKAFLLSSAEFRKTFMR